MSSERYYIESGEDEEDGPSTLEELREDASLTGATLVRREGETTRRPLGDLLAERSAREAESARLRAEMKQLDNTGFCKRCFAHSTAQGSGSIRCIYGFGLRFYGAAERCFKCSSVVRVLWLVFAFVPILPLGTYRYQAMNSNILYREFLTRSTRTRWSQVLSHWLALVAVVAVLALMR